MDAESAHVLEIKQKTNEDFKETQHALLVVAGHGIIDCNPCFL